MTGSSSGVTYTAFRNSDNVQIGSPKVATGANLHFSATNAQLTGSPITTFYIIAQAPSPNSCSARLTDMSNITKLTQVTATVTPTNGLCFGQQNTIAATGAGGTAPYQMSTAGAGGPFNTSPRTVADGTYQVVVRDNNLCVSQAYPTTVAAPAKVSFQFDSASATCSSSNAFITFKNAAGGSGIGYQYSVNGDHPANYFVSPNFTGLAAGNYSLITKDNNDCKSDITNITLTNQGTINTGFSTLPAPLCYGDSGTITLSAVGASGKFKYALTATSTTPAAGVFKKSNIFRVLAGSNNYGFVMDSISGCIVKVNNGNPISVSSASKININISSIVPTTCFTSSDGKINMLAATGGAGFYTYDVDAPFVYGAFNPQYTGLAKGTHTISVKDGNGCKQDSVVTVGSPPAITYTSFTTKDLKCYNVLIGEIHLSATGGTGALTYALGAGAYGGTKDFLTLDGGVYTVHVKDANLCIKDSTVTLAEPAQFAILSQTKTNITCNGLTNGIVDVKATGGTLPYVYTLNPGGTTNATGTFNGLSANTYTVSITEANACGTLTSNPLVITNPAVIVIDSTPKKNITCGGLTNGEIRIYAKGGTWPYTYTISAGTPITKTADSAFLNLTAGSYTISVTDKNNCTAATAPAVTITSPAPVAWNKITTVFTNPLCNNNTNGTITGAASGGTGALQYWLDNGTKQLSGSFGSLSANTYALHVIDTKACQKDTSFTLVNPAAIAIATSAADTVCAGGQGQIRVTATGGNNPLTYTLAPGGTLNATGIFNNQNAGNYTVTVSDPKSCPTAVANVTVRTAVAPTITVNKTDVLCNGANTGSITVNATNGKTPYTYSVNGDVPANYQASNIFNSLNATTTYNVYVKNSCASYSYGTVNLTQPAKPLAINSVSTTKVKGAIKGTATVNVLPTQDGSGTLQYWYDSNPVNLVPPTNKFINLNIGNYTANVKDANNCQVSMPFSIVDSGVITLTVNVTDASCNGMTDGAISPSVTGGTGPYNYTYTPAIADINNVAPGTYKVKVTDSNSKADSTNVVVGQPTVVKGNFVVNDYDGTAGTGNILVTGTGGNGPLYTYKYNGGAPSSTNYFSNLAANTNHTFRIIDADGCESLDTTITVYNAAVLALNSPTWTDVKCFGTSTATATVHIKSGKKPFRVSLKNGAGVTVVPNTWIYQKDTTFTGLLKGTYQFNVKHSLPGATVNSATFTIIELATSLLKISSTDITPQTTIAPNGAIQINATGGVGSSSSYQFSKDNGATYDLNSGLYENLAGDSTYKVAVQDNVGCIIFSTATVPNGLPLVVDFNKTNKTSCLPGNVSYNVTSGIPPYMYSFDNVTYIAGTASETITKLPGTYTLYVKDKKDTVSQTLTIDPASPVKITNIATTPSANGSTGTMTVTTIGGSGTYNYSYTAKASAPHNNGTDNKFINLPADSFFVKADDGCSFNIDTAVVPKDTVLLGKIDSIEQIKCIQPNLQAFINVSVSNASVGSIYYKATSAISGEIIDQFDDGRLEVKDSGKFYIYIRDAEGKRFRDTVTVRTVVDSIAITFDPVKQLCSATEKTNIKVNVKGGKSPYSFEWLKNAIPISSTEQELTNQGQGVYTVQVTDKYNCKKSEKQPIFLADVKITSMAVINSVCNVGKTTGSIKVNAVSPISKLTYTWEPTLPDTNNVTKLGPGTYKVVVSNSSNCSATQSKNITAINTLTMAWETKDASCSSGDAFVKYNVTAGSQPYTFTTNVTDILNNAPASYQKTLTTSGNYKFKLTDLKGCYDSTILNVSSLPIGDSIIIDTVKTTIASGGSTGSLKIDAHSTLSSPLAYTVTRLEDNVKIDNTAGLVAYYPFSGNANDVSGNGMNGTVNGASLTKDRFGNANSAYSFDGVNDFIEIIPKSSMSKFNDFTLSVWSKNEGWKNQTSDRQYIFDGHAAGKDVSGNLYKEGFMIYYDSLSSSISANAGILYSETDYSKFYTNTNDTSKLSNKWHHIILKRNGDKLSMFFDGVPVNHATGNSVSQALNMDHPWYIGTFCGNNPNYVGNGSYKGAIDDLIIYNRAMSDKEIQSLYTQTSSSIDKSYYPALKSGKYKVKVANTADCDSATKIVTVPQDTILKATIAFKDSICNGARVIISTSNAYGKVTYTIKTDSVGFSINQIKDSLFTVSHKGVYHIKALDSEGKVYRKDTLITTSIPKLFVIRDSLVTPKCGIGNIGSMYVHATGGTPNYSYVWTKSNTTDTVSLVANLINKQSGVYKLLFKDSQGCSSTYTDSIIIVEVKIKNINLTHSDCNINILNGKIIAKASGKLPLIFNWTDSGSKKVLRTDTSNTHTDSIINLAPSKYAVHITDADGCPMDTTVSVVAKDTINFDLIATQPNCTGNAGSVQLLSTNGKPKFSYTIDATAIVTGLQKIDTVLTTIPYGKHIFRVDDKAGCYETDSVELKFVNTIALIDTITPEKCDKYGQIGLKASNIKFPALLKFSSRNDTITLTDTSLVTIGNLRSNDYTAKVWNSIPGCVVENKFKVILSDTLKISASISGENCLNLGSINIKVLNSSIPFKYKWAELKDSVSKATDDTIMRKVTKGLYHIAIWNNDHGCAINDTAFKVPVTDTLDVDAGSDTIICRGNEYILQGWARAGTVLGNADAMYNWSPAKNLVGENNIVKNPIVKAYIPNVFKEKPVYYKLSVSYGHCTKKDSVKITYFPTNGVWLPRFDTASKGEYEVMPIIGGTGNYVRYMWAPHKYVVRNSDTARNLVVNFMNDSLTYQFTGITADGCMEQANITLIATDEIKPNGAFTPNGDGDNEFWYIPNAEFFPDINVVVINRWGDKVFEMKGYNNQDKVWYGKRSGKDLPIGTYYYIITMGGSKSQRGTVTIIR
jgi:gliding motility-associated-like protein